MINTLIFFPPITGVKISWILHAYLCIQFKINANLISPFCGLSREILDGWQLCCPEECLECIPRWLDVGALLLGSVALIVLGIAMNITNA